MRARILVVEDNHDSLNLIDIVLSARGCIATLATDGEEGMRLAELMQPDLVLLDIEMPLADGYEVAASIRRNPALEHTRIVAVSARAHEDRRRIAAAGFDGCIAKPIDPETFVAELEQYLPAAPG